MITKISSYDLLRLPVKKGKIYYVTDYRLLYKDYTNDINNRATLPAMVLNTENQRMNKIRPVQGVNYYVIETNCLWMYDTRWVLKDGSRNYNTYTFDSTNAVSPVMIDNEEIQNSQGDKILDNNGLLGDGSLVVRDSNRIRKGLVAVNDIRKTLEITSYVEDGIILRPYGLAQTAATRNTVGALKLGVQMGTWGPTGFERTSYKGKAEYNGDFDIEGQLNLILSSNAYNADIFTVPEQDESVEFEINCLKTSPTDFEDRKEKNVITIIPITQTSAKVRIITYTVASTEVPEGNETLIYSAGYEYDAVRTASSSDVLYTVLGSGLTIRLEPPVGSTYAEADSITVTFSDDTYHDSLEARATLHYKKSYNISSLVDTTIDLSTRVQQLESQVQTLTQIVNGLHPQSTSTN